MTSRLCVDTSAWHRSSHQVVADTWVSHLNADRLSICDQVRLEVLYSARSATDYEQLAEELESLHLVPTDRVAFVRAMDVQARLSRVGGLHHRSVKIADLLIAASAEAAGDIIWHYDEDFDRIAAITGQRCEWIAPRGAL